MTTITNAPVEQWAKDYTGPKFHALLSDPPYELAFGGNKWDATGIAFNPDTWRALSTHLFPGAFIMVFASSVGWHRLAVAIEDAGFTLHPTIFNWVRAGGWPKSVSMGDPDFEGHRYGRQALKPAVEPIIVAQKPYELPALASIKQTGAGALNVDAARIPDEQGELKATFGGVKGQLDGGFKKSVAYQYNPHPDGRYPANFTLQHLPECERICADTCPVKRFSESDQTEDAGRFFLRAGWALDIEERLYDADAVKYAHRPRTAERDAGVGNEYEKENNGFWKGLAVGGTGLPYAGLKRNNHPTVKPLELTSWLAKLLLPPDKYAPRRLLVPFCGTFSEGLGGLIAGFEEVHGVEMEAEFAQIGRQRAAWWEQALAVSESQDVGVIKAKGDEAELYQGRLI